ncbi:hypothetical protein Nepgr_027452 [Nepenthes gracilis]|uniref:Cytochrome P450 n=1 Tax=Nepenthes gracilis TaxID=150966 RepID=A0AAD3TAU1_NEPGR|nr:hypothetical protein Nepgr_027452 [Nepenthes gracilis]
MELRDTVTSIAIFLTCAVALRWAWRLFDWVFLRPKKLERCLRQQGISGNSYRLLLGDMKEVFRMRKEARSKPIAFTNDYLSRADPFLHHTITNYGKNSLAWMGPIPMVNITEPKLIREALSNIYDFQKPKLNSVISLLAPGLVSLEGKQWAMRRKLMNPAFHAEKLKMMLPSFYTSCNEMIKKWEKMMVGTDSHELDVWPYLVILTEDVISRAAFGSSYEEGKKIFELLKEQIHLTVQLSHTVFIPGLSTFGLLQTPLPFTSPSAIKNVFDNVFCQHCPLPLPTRILGHYLH